VIPTYNAGRLLSETVRQALAEWAPVWVVVDGSTDGSPDDLDKLAASDERLTVIDRGRNGGKGAAVLDALRHADRMGFTHVLVMDSDGQHPPDRIATLMAMSAAHPNAMVLGRPIFGADAPAARIYFRRVSNFLANVETFWCGIGDALFGFRVYPVRPLLDAMTRTRWMRRFDFDPEAAIRLSWVGIRPVNVDVPVRYLPADQGGVSHFHYVRDNLLLTWMNLRLVCGQLRRLPARMRALPIFPLREAPAREAPAGPVPELPRE
jgi:glycosyltransferase involved in cell wall biosynthesis